MFQKILDVTGSFYGVSMKIIKEGFIQGGGVDPIFKTKDLADGTHWLAYIGPNPKLNREWVEATKEKSDEMDAKNAARGHPHA